MSNEKPDKTHRGTSLSDEYTRVDSPVHISNSEPPQTPIPQLFRKGYELVFPSKRGDVVMVKKPSKAPEDPVEAYKKSMQWKWWLVGIMGSLVALGFYSSQHLSNYETKMNVERARNTHEKIHTKIDERFDSFGKQITDIRFEQIRQSERVKLLDTRIELLLEVQSQKHRRINDSETARLRQEIEVQQERLRQIERNPRVKRAMPEALLKSLDL